LLTKKPSATQISSLPANFPVAIRKQSVVTFACRLEMEKTT
jgi:hypothetical protein